MTAPVSIGYLQPRPERVEVGQPEITYGGYPVAEDGTAPDWHYLSDIRIAWQIDVDLVGVRADCGLSDTARIGALITWHSDRTNLRGGSDLGIVRTGPNRLALHLPGDELGGTLNLDARLVLAANDRHAGMFAPRRPGSHLWSLRTRVVLEGTGGRFPTTTCDFAAAGLPGGGAAPWYLEITSRDLAAAATSCMRLFLNETHPDIAELLTQPDSARSATLRRVLRYDTTRQLVRLALTEDEFDNRAPYEPASLGDLLTTVLATTVPGRTLDQLRLTHRQQPADIDADVLAATWPPEA